jgi:hypothetical protein
MAAAQASTASAERFHALADRHATEDRAGLETDDMILRKATGSYVSLDQEIGRAFRYE